MARACSRCRVQGLKTLMVIFENHQGDRKEALVRALWLVLFCQAGVIFQGLGRPLTQSLVFDAGRRATDVDWGQVAGANEL
eukprot:COSAG01_NODE_57943_length_309_cov_0.733333_1_plen_80_part_01